MKIIIEDIIRMYDTDSAKRLFFGHIYRFANNAFEAFLYKEKYDYETLFEKSSYAFVVVHSEADYTKTLRLGEKIKIETEVSHIGTSSFTFECTIYNKNTNEIAGVIKTIHVTIDPKTNQKIPIPHTVKEKLTKYLKTE